LGLIPKSVPEKLKKIKINQKRILEIEKETHHDLIAFTTSLSEQMGDEGRFLHFGATSSDIVDTALSLQIQESSRLLIPLYQGLLSVLKKRAFETKDILTIGRSHGIHAEPTSFGLKFVSFYEEMRRNLDRFEEASKGLAIGQLSGPVGNYSFNTPEIEVKVCELLELNPDPISTQVIARDRHAAFFSAIAITASSIERMAVEFRHLQRTEVLELEEGFSKGQKGSSAMPHKKNPISAENLTGCARLLRSYLNPALENIPLWHERDISHSSVERLIFPDACILLDYALTRLKNLIEGLVIKEESIQKNLDQLKGLPFSAAVLLDFVSKGLTREEAYVIVQRAAHEAWDQNRDFLEVLYQEPKAKKLYSTLDSLKDSFSKERYLREVNAIYDRVF